MNFKEKKQVFNQLLDTNFLEADRRLLRRYQPNSNALCLSGNQDKQASETLWELLDYAGEDEINNSRQEKEVLPVVVREVVREVAVESKKKVLTKRLSIPISGGRILTMKMCKKLLSFTTTGLIVLRKYGNWTKNWTISLRLRE